MCHGCGMLYGTAKGAPVIPMDWNSGESPTSRKTPGDVHRIPICSGGPDLPHQKVGDLVPSTFLI